ncbi:MAG: GNAT family N-acetyltransferase [Thermonemataceae bacterium]|nr:GNAT family N-acetyltransferase [Thermonemataceae bacterium]
MKIANQYFPSFHTSKNDVVYFRRLNEFDVQPLVDFYYRLSHETRYLRFQMITENLPEKKIYEYAEQLCLLSNQGLAIVAYILQNDGSEVFVGVARYILDTNSQEKAEFAIVLDDAYQGLGIGIYLLSKLFEEAKRYGLRVIYGTMLYSNTGMVQLIKKLCPENHHFHHLDGQMEVEIKL